MLSPLKESPDRDVLEELFYMGIGNRNLHD